MKPLDVGDVHDVVIRLSLNYDGLEYLVSTLEGYYLGRGLTEDSFVTELRGYLTEVDRALEYEAVEA